LPSYLDLIEQNQNEYGKSGRKQKRRGDHMFTKHEMLYTITGSVPSYGAGSPPLGKKLAGRWVHQKFEIGSRERILWFLQEFHEQPSIAGLIAQDHEPGGRILHLTSRRKGITSAIPMVVAVVFW
jgi:hypothetical protein